MNTSVEPSRRITEQLHSYWKKIKGKRHFPAESEVNPDALKDIWDNCFLIDVSAFGGTEGFRYAYLGSNLIEAYGDQLTEEEAIHLISTDNEEVVGKIKQVLRSKAPLSIDSQFTNSSNIEIRFREILLPLGTDDSKVEYIIGAMRWKAF